MNVVMYVLALLACPFWLSGDEIDTYIEKVMEKKGIPGLVLVIFDGEKGNIRTFGYSDKAHEVPMAPTTLFRIASITKVFTGLELALQVVRGNMQLKDPLVKYIPHLRYGHHAIERVTLLELATHTASLPRDPPRKSTHAKLMRFLDHWHPAYGIGTRYVYSNLSFGLLGMAMAHREGLPYEHLIRRDILRPLQMHATRVQHPNQRIEGLAVGYKPDNAIAPGIQVQSLPGGGGLISNAQDMLKFLKANLGFDLGLQMKEAMNISHASYFRANERLTLGLGWQKIMLEGQEVLDKNGGLAGFGSYIGFIPSKKMGVVLLANKSKIQSTGIGRQVLRMLLKNN